MENVDPNSSSECRHWGIRDRKQIFVDSLDDVSGKNKSSGVDKSFVKHKARQEKKVKANSRSSSKERHVPESGPGAGPQEGRSQAGLETPSRGMAKKKEGKKVAAFRRGLQKKPESMHLVRRKLSGGGTVPSSEQTISGIVQIEAFVDRRNRVLGARRGDGEKRRFASPKAPTWIKGNAGWHACCKES